MKVLKSFVRKKKIYVRKKRIKYRRYAVKKIHILSRKIEEKESMRKHFKVKKNEDQSKVRVTQRSVCRLFQDYFKVRIHRIIDNNLFLNKIFFFEMNFQKKV